MAIHQYQAVVLLDEGSKELYPLVSKDFPKGLLPVGNHALLTYSLQLLEACSFGTILLVVSGKAAVEQYNNWLTENIKSRVQVEVVAVADDAGTADALRAVSHLLTAENVLVVSGDVVSDVSLGALAAAHQQQAAAATVLLRTRSQLGISQDKAQSASVHDFLALDSSGTGLLYFASGMKKGSQLLIRGSLLRSAGQMTIRTDLIDTQIYAFNRRILQSTLESRPNISSLKHDLLPYLVQTQLGQASIHVQLPVEASGPVALSSSKLRGTPPPDGSRANELRGLGSSNLQPQMDMAHLMSHSARSSNAAAAAAAGRCCVLMLPSSSVCMQVNSLQSYADANRELAGDAVHLTGHSLSSHNNVLHPTAELGSRTTVGPQCMVGEMTVFGDKCSIKKSLVGRHCKIGMGVKITNSVLMDGVVLDDGCVLQNCVLGASVRVLREAALRDCQVAAGYVVGEKAEHKGELLAKKS